MGAVIQRNWLIGLTAVSFLVGFLLLPVALTATLHVLWRRPWVERSGYLLLSLLGAGIFIPKDTSGGGNELWGLIFGFVVVAYAVSSCLTVLVRRVMI